MSGRPLSSVSLSSTPASSSNGQRAASPYDVQSGRPSESPSSSRIPTPLQRASEGQNRRHSSFLLGSLSRRTGSAPLSPNGIHSDKGQVKGKEKEKHSDSDDRSELRSKDLFYRSSLKFDGSLSGSNSSQSRPPFTSSPKDEFSSRIPRRSPSLDSRPRQDLRPTDPATLVNLALQLSQSRARTTSARFNPHFAGAGSGINGRNVSLGSSKLSAKATQIPRPTASKEPLRNAILSEKSMVDGDTALGKALPNGSAMQGNGGDVVLQETGLEAPDSMQYPASPQTLIRAERAQIALELRYHHRRVLQYLPKLPFGDNKRQRLTGNQNGSVRDDSENLLPNEPLQLGLQYNPLQYARNRKTRYRTRRTLKTEEQDWKNLERVRNWVDEVADTSMNALESNTSDYTLPPFSGCQDGEALGSARPSFEFDRPQSTGIKPAAPPNDWTVHPWDLLADTYWLQQDDNRLLIEDSHGVRVFDSHSADGSNTLEFKKADNQGFGRPKSFSISKKSRSRPPTASPVSPDLVIGSPGSMGFSPTKSYTGHATGKKSTMKRLSKRLFRATRSHSSSSEELPVEIKKRPWSADFGKQDHIDHPSQKAVTQNLDQQPLHGQTRSSIERPPFHNFGGKLPFSRGYTAFTNGDRMHEQDERFDHTSLSEIEAENSGRSPHLGLSPAVTPDRGKSYLDKSPTRNPIRSSLDFVRHKGTERKDFANDLFNGYAITRSSNEHEKTTHPVLSSPSESSFSTISDGRRGQLLPGFNTGIGNSDRELGLLPLKSWKDVPFVGRARGLLRRRDTGTDTASDTDNESRLQAKRLALAKAATSSATSIDSRVVSVPDSTLESPRYRGLDLPTFRSSRVVESPSHKHTKQASSSSWNLPEDNTSRQAQESPPNSGLPPHISARLVDEDLKASSLPQSRNASRRRPTLERRGATVTDASGIQWPMKHRTDAPPWPGQDQNGTDTTKIAWTGPELRPTRAGRVTARDLDRTQAVLSATMIKASLFIEQYEQAKPVRSSSSSHLIKEIQSFGHVLAEPFPSKLHQYRILADVIASQIGAHSARTEKALQLFSNETQPRLDSGYQDIKDHVQDVVVERAMVIGDNADSLGAQVAGECTLAVKELNDRIDGIWRARRRRSRWLTRLVFAVLEWTVLSIMWGLWFAVVCFKLARGVVVGSISATKWLLWL